MSFETTGRGGERGRHEGMKNRSPGQQDHGGDVPHLTPHA